MNAGDFQIFYQENLGLIYRFVFSKVDNHQEAEDRSELDQDGERQQDADEPLTERGHHIHRSRNLTTTSVDAKESTVNTSASPLAAA